MTQEKFSIITMSRRLFICMLKTTTSFQWDVHSCERKWQIQPAALENHVSCKYFYIKKTCNKMLL